MKNDRRDFIVKTLQGTAYITFGAMLPACQTTPGTSNRTVKGYYKTLYLEVRPDNKFLLTFDKVEMGQGVITGQATLFGEEADIHPESFIMKPASVNPAFAGSSGLQITAGSSSTFERWTVLREAGARYRWAVIKAAAKTWGVAEGRVESNNGVVYTKDGKFKEKYATFNDALSLSSQDSEVKLKDPQNFKYIGRFSKSVDRRPKTLGQAQYAMDLDLPNKKVAIVLRCPVHGGTLKAFDQDKVNGVPGVVDAMIVSGGLGIICDKYYQTLTVRKQIKESWLDWDIPEEYLFDTPKMFEDYRSKLSLEKPSIDDDEILVSADYELPYLAHAPMEPQNCTVWRKKDRLEMWVPTQGPTLSQNIGAAISNLDRDQVVVHTAKFLGGGFGRRTSDSIIDAVEIANKVSYPVQVIWSREDDMRFSALRPMAVTRMVAVAKKGKIKSWQYQTVSQSIIQGLLENNGSYFLPEWVPQFLGRGLGKAAAGAMGLVGAVPIAKSGAKQPYDLPYDLDTEEVNSPIPTVFWRSVGSSLNGFFVESFIDEVALGLNQDPLEFRQELLQKEPRALAVVNKVAELAQWKQNKPTKTRALGLAYHYSYRTHCAQVADVEVSSGGIKIHRILTVVDCGTVVNPHIVENQVRSAVIYGLSAILHGEITFKGGKVEQENFDRYPILRMNETPSVDVYTMPSSEHPTGIGEPGLPAVAAAVCNSIFRSSGQRIRKLPIQKNFQTRGFKSVSD